MTINEKLLDDTLRFYLVRWLFIIVVNWRRMESNSIRAIRVRDSNSNLDKAKLSRAGIWALLE